MTAPVLCRRAVALQAALVEIDADGKRRPETQARNVHQLLGEHVEHCDQCSTSLGIQDEEEES